MDRSGDLRIGLSICMVLMLTLFVLPLQSQEQSGIPKWYAGATAGGTILYGDLQANDEFLPSFSKEFSPAFGLQGGYRFNPIWTAYFSAHYGGFRGEKQRDELIHSYTAGFAELYAGARVDFFNLFTEPRSRLVNPYLFTGAGAIIFRAQAENELSGFLIGSAGYDNSSGALKKASPEWGAVFPFGGGLMFRMNDRWETSLELGLRFTTTDLLDGVNRGKQNDAYYLMSAGVSYGFGRNKFSLPPYGTPALAGINPEPEIPVEIDCRFPAHIYTSDTLEMRCIISKGPITGRAELTQVLPIGFEVLDTAIAGADRITFRDYTLSLYWDSLPARPVIPVTYKVYLDKVYGSLPMSSILYLEQTRKEYKSRTDILIKKKEEGEPFFVIDEEPEVEAQTVHVAEVEFRVQVSASLGKKLELKTLEQKFDLPGAIREEKYDNWFKYTSGSFRTYNDAKKYKEELLANHNVQGAFVIAYFNGERLEHINKLLEVSPGNYPGKAQAAKPGTLTLPQREICYRVQILALMNTSEPVEKLKSRYRLTDPVNEEVYANWRKYTVGDCYTWREALSQVQKLKAKGLSGAFPVKYKNGERVSGY